MQYIKFENFINSTQYGYTAETTSPISGDAKYLRITDIVPYFVEKDRVPYCAIDASKVNKYLVHDGDVLIARTGATTGYNLVVDDSFKNYVFASYLIRFNYDRKKLHPRYLKYVLKSPSWYGFVNNYIGGSAQPGMNARVFGKYYLPYTDFSTQQKIASILSAYDSLIENNKKRIKLLEQMAEDLYKEWFVRFRFPGHETAEFEGGVPKGWKKVELNSILSKITTGLNPRKNFVLGQGSNYYVTIKNMSDNTIFLDEKCDKIDDEAITIINKRSDLQTGDILFSGIGTIGRVYLIDIPTHNWNVSESVFTLRANNQISKEYLYSLLLSNDFQNYCQLHSQGAAQLGIRMAELKSFKFALPDERIIKLFTDKITHLLQFVSSLRRNNRLLTTQRDILLPRLMSGKLSI